MNANERDEITASVAAHAELGSRYDSAVAEGLVERIGDEIDRRIDARLGGQSQPGRPPQGGNNAAPAYQGPPAYRGPAAPTPSMPVAAPPPQVARRAGGLSGVILGLGSMGIGIGATAVVVANHVESVVALFMVILIWGAIAVINIAHAQRRL
ncbi:MAG: hypothetical protein ACRDNO_32800 [Trebonia sp.]